MPAPKPLSELKKSTIIRRASVAALEMVDLEFAGKKLTPEWVKARNRVRRFREELERRKLEGK
jgi:hypothetical protein